MSKTALLLIDVQMCMFNPEYPVYQDKQLIANLQELLAKARASKTPVVYVQHCGDSGAPHEPGQPGWEINPDIAPDPEDMIVQKKTPDSFFETDLQDALTKLQVDKLVMAGIQTDYCVDTTCRRAFSLGYDVTLAKDAHSTWGDSGLTADQIIDHHNAVLGNWFAKVQTSSEIQF